MVASRKTKVARTSIFILAILGYFIVIDQRAWMAEAKSNIITLVCSGKTTGFPNKFPDKSAVIDSKFVFVVDVDKKLVNKVPAEVDEKSISYTWEGNNGESILVNIARVTGEATVTQENNRMLSIFSGNCVRSEGPKF